MGPTEITPSMPVSDSGAIGGGVCARQAQENRARSTKIIGRRCCLFINDNSAFERCFCRVFACCRRSFQNNLPRPERRKGKPTVSRARKIPSHSHSRKSTKSISIQDIRTISTGTSRWTITSFLCWYGLYVQLSLRCPS